MRRLTGHELPFLKAHSPGAIKMTLPSATQFPAIAFKRGVTDAVYPDHSALLWDIVEIMKTELAALAAEGVAYIQIDAPRYSYFMDPEVARVDPHRDGARTRTRCSRSRSGPTTPAWPPRGARASRVAMHLCRGNNRSHWYAEGGYDAIAEKLFGTMDVDRFLLEYDDDRSGTLRAAALRAPRQDGRARAGQLEAAARWRAPTSWPAASTRPPATCPSRTWP